MPVASESMIGDYYDRLTRWSRISRAFGRRSAGLSVHRALSDPAARGRATTSRLHDVLLAHLPQMTSPMVLDAGCGLGGTILFLAPRIGGRYVGLTLSRTQASVAADAFSHAGLAGQAEVLVRSFDDPPSGPFDLVIMIESLAHSRNPARTLAGLAEVVAPRGLLVLVDDMPKPEAFGSAELARFKSGWSCPVLWAAEDCRDQLAGLGATIIVDHDLSDGYRPRELMTIRALEWLNRGLRYLVPLSGWRSVMDSHYGGLALERLYRSSVVCYRLLVARWP